MFLHPLAFGSASFHKNFFFYYFCLFNQGEFIPCTVSIEEGQEIQSHDECEGHAGPPPAGAPEKEVRGPTPSLRGRVTRI